MLVYVQCSIMKLGIKTLAFEDAKKRLFYILKHHFIYFTNLFYNSPYILIFMFTYNLIKEYKLLNKIKK